MAYEPFIEDPEHIRAVDGQRFVVLRPGAVVRELYNHLQVILRRRFADLPISYPAQAHMTLAGFGVGTSLRAVQELVELWSRTVPALRLTLERLAFFPAPSQIVIMQVLKTPELLAALSLLWRQAEKAQLAIDTTISPQDWIFHLSVAYCSKLSGPAWNELVTCGQLESPSAFCTVNEVEVVAFDDGREHSGGVYALQTAPVESTA
jgi:2'-5' RNA ligase